MDVEAFGKFIAESRRAKGLTQTELADKIGVTDKAVSRWERGRGFPDISLLEPLAGVLDVSLLELMHGERVPNQEGPDVLTEQDAAELMRCAAEIEREQQLQNKTVGWLSVLVTLAVGALVMLTGHGNLGGGLFVGALAAEVVVSLYYYRKNLESESSRRVYGMCLLLGVGVLQYTFDLMKIDPYWTTWMIYGVLSAVLAWQSR